MLFRSIIGWDTGPDKRVTVSATCVVVVCADRLICSNLITRVSVNGMRMRTWVPPLVAIAVMIWGTAPEASANEVAVPVEVTNALANFGANPQDAITTWATWAAVTPMTYVRKGRRPNTRSNCRIDTSGIADCNDFAEVIGRGNRNMGMKKFSEIITSGNRQFFRDPPLKQWTKTKTISNPNPITGIADRVGYNPWLPWSSGADAITTRMLENGTLEIAASNPSPREGQASKTVARIAANGLQATVIEYDKKDRISNVTRITLKTVPNVKIPRAG